MRTHWLNLGRDIYGATTLEPLVGPRHVCSERDAFDAATCTVPHVMHPDTETVACICICRWCGQWVYQDDGPVEEEPLTLR